MKIAICLAGHVRSNSTISIIEQLPNYGIEYEVFVSSWNTSGMWLEPTELPYNKQLPLEIPRLGIYEHDRTEINTGIFGTIKNLNKCEIEDDKQLLPEILKLCETYKDIIEPGDFDMDREDQRKYQIFSMYRKCQRSIDLVEGDFDLIMRTRFDCYFDINALLRNIDRIISSDALLIPSNYEFGGENAPGGGRLCDSFALGSPENIRKYGKIYDFLTDPSTPQFFRDNDIWFCPHSLLRQHLIKSEVKYIKDHIDYDLVRSYGRMHGGF